MTTMTKSAREVLATQWNDLGTKLQALAEAMPAAAWETRPVPAVRSADEVLRHLVFWNRWVADTARGGSPDGAANEIARAQAPNQAAAIAAFAASQAEAGAPLATGEGELAVEQLELYASFLAHTAEHYGQLVVYARLHGVVPPASR